MKTLILVITIISFSIPCETFHLGFVYNEKTSYDVLTDNKIEYGKYMITLVFGFHKGMYEEIDSRTFSDFAVKKKFPKSITYKGWKYEDSTYKYHPFSFPFKTGSSPVDGFVKVYEYYIEPVHKQRKRKVFSAIVFKDLIKGPVRDTVFNNINLTENGLYGVGTFVERLFVKKYDDLYDDSYFVYENKGIYFALKKERSTFVMKKNKVACKDGTRVDTIQTTEVDSTLEKSTSALLPLTSLSKKEMFNVYNVLGTKKFSTIKF